MTASNGRVTDPSSLHFIGTEQPNEYHIAINAVAEICQHYNNTKMFMAAGFGAKLPYQDRVSHCFPLVSSWIFSHFLNMTSEISQVLPLLAHEFDSSPCLPIFCLPNPSLSATFLSLPFPSIIGWKLCQRLKPKLDLSYLIISFSFFFWHLRSCFHKLTAFTLYLYFESIIL